MRTLLRSLLVAIVLACSSSHPKPPEAPQPKGVRFRVDLGKKPNQDELEQYVRKVISSRFADVMDVTVKVWWTPEILRYHLKGDKGLGYYYGLHFTCDEIYVYDRGLCESSFIHELLHCFHTVLTGDGDKKHTNKIWWDLVDPMKAECSRRGWK